MPDSTPNYLTVDPQGRVSADFTGDINARSLIVDAGNVLGVQFQEDDGHIRAFLQAFLNGAFGDELSIRTGDSQTYIKLRSVEGASGAGAIWVQAHGDPGRRLIDGTGFSDWSLSERVGFITDQFSSGVSTAAPPSPTDGSVFTIPNSHGELMFRLDTTMFSDVDGDAFMIAYVDGAEVQARQIPTMTAGVHMSLPPLMWNDSGLTPGDHFLWIQAFGAGPGVPANPQADDTDSFTLTWQPTLT